MGSSILFNLEFLLCKSDISDVWEDKPTVKEYENNAGTPKNDEENSSDLSDDDDEIYSNDSDDEEEINSGVAEDENCSNNYCTILYSVITPVICSFGICGNTLSLTVLKRKELMGSIYTYLAVLAASDLLMSFILFFGGLSRGVLYYRGWATYDALVGLPLGGAINTLSVIATVAVTIDRVLFLWNPVQCTKPKFCDRTIARRIMTGALFFSILLNIPYCFIFTWKDDNTLMTTEFFDSQFYTSFNWLMLIFFSIIPGIILILGNGFLILSLKKARKISVKCNGKRRDHTNLTITLISIIVLFLFSEIPATLVSRTNAVPILFSGNHDRVQSRTLEVIRQFCTLLGAINVTVNFLFYYLFCPAFVKALSKTFQRKKKFFKEGLQVNVFVLNSHRIEVDNQKNHQTDSKVKAKILELSRKSLEMNFTSAFFKGCEDKDNNGKGSSIDSCEDSCEKKLEESEYVVIVDDYHLPRYSIIMEESSEDSSVIKDSCTHLNKI